MISEPTKSTKMPAMRTHSAEPTLNGLHKEKKSIRPVLSQTSPHCPSPMPPLPQESSSQEKPMGVRTMAMVKQRLVMERRIFVAGRSWR